MESYKHWTWSNGLSIEKTYKPNHNNGVKMSVPHVDEVTEKKELNTEALEKLKLESDRQNKINKFVEFEQIQLEPSNKRQETSERMTSRHMIIQKPINPFLKDSDYLNDLNVQDTLLRPRNSNAKNTYLVK